MGEKILKIRSTSIIKIGKMFLFMLKTNFKEKFEPNVGKIIVQNEILSVNSPEKNMLIDTTTMWI